MTTRITDRDLKYNHQAAIEDAIGPIKTAFNDLQTIQRRTIVDIQSSQGTSQLRDLITTEGTGTEVEGIGTGEISLETGATADSRAIIESAEFGQYSSGFIAMAGIGVRVPSLPTQEAFAKWGYYNGINGFYFGLDADGLYVALMRNSIEIKKVYRENWNGTDPDDVRDEGNEFTVDEGAIYQISYAWYGYGGIEFSIVSANDDNEQKPVTVHQMTVDGQTSITNPNQPLRAEVDNDGSDDNLEIFIGGRQYSILGDSTQGTRITSDSAFGQDAPADEWTAIQSFRRKADNERRVNARLGTFAVETDEDLRVAYVLNPDIGGTPTWTTPELTPARETMFEFSTDATFAGIGSGTKIWEGLVPVGGRGSDEGNLTLAEIGQVIPRDQPVMMIAQPIGGPANVDAVTRVEEDW